MSTKLKGIKWPFQFNAGRVAQSSGVQHIRESVLQIIGIDKGEYLYRLDFGSDLNRRVFSPANALFLVRSDIFTAVQKYEKRVTINNVSAYTDPAQLGTVHVIVNFTYNDTYEQLIYDFNSRG